MGNPKLCDPSAGRLGGSVAGEGRPRTDVPSAEDDLVVSLKDLMLEHATKVNFGTSLNPRSSIGFRRWALNSSSHVHQAGQCCVARVPPNMCCAHVLLEISRGLAAEVPRQKILSKTGPFVCEYN
jgi:hypothetical protein